MTRVRCEIVPLPENFAEAVRNLPKPAPVRKGGRPEGQRAHGEGRGRPERAHRPDGVRPERDGEARRPFRNRKTTGAYKGAVRSEEHTSELQSLMRSSYSAFC